MTAQIKSAVKFLSIPTEDARQIQSGGTDENGHEPDRMISDGGGFPCRHCLQEIDAGDEVLVLSYRPFPAKQAYAEAGPIFLHSKECSAHQDDGQLPRNIKSQGVTLIRGYNSENKIVYGSGKTVPSHTVAEEAEQMFASENIAYIHARSSTNNCFTCRIERA